MVLYEPDATMMNQVEINYSEQVYPGTTAYCLTFDSNNKQSLETVDWTQEKLNVEKLLVKLHCLLCFMDDQNFTL